MKIVKQQGFADSCGIRNLTHGAVLVRISGEDAVACIYDELLPFRRQGKKSFVHGILSPLLTDLVNFILRALTDFEKTLFMTILRITTSYLDMRIGGDIKVYVCHGNDV